jgi:hypothetical protein
VPGRAGRSHYPRRRLVATLAHSHVCLALFG